MSRPDIPLLKSALNGGRRESGGSAWLEGLYQDLRYAARGFARDRGFTLTTIAMLALVLGLNVAVFAVVNTMLFQGFPLVKDNSRLVYIQERYTLTNGCCLLYADFLAWRDQVHSFSEMAFVGSKPAAIHDDEYGTRDANPTLLTANTFELFGVRPALGRDFVRTDELPGAPQVLILSYADWVTRYGRRADIIGHQLHVNKAPATIIGVMSEGFDFPAHGAMWMPLQPNKEMLDRKADGFFAIGRLRAGATLKRARAELDGVNQALEMTFPASNKGVRPTARNFSEFNFGSGCQDDLRFGMAGCRFGAVDCLRELGGLDAGAHIGPGTGALHTDRSWRGVLEDEQATSH